jgi:hypothetical protein
VRGRIRTVKPELFSDETLWDLEKETGLPLLRVFVGLWCYCDRDGRFVWSPRALRGAIAPCWDGDMAAALEALASKLYIVRYTVNGRDYGYVRTFSEHQAINGKELPSGLPPPVLHATDTRAAREEHATVTRPEPIRGEGKGREGKGREGKGMDMGRGAGEEFAPPSAPLDSHDETALHRKPDPEPKPARKKPACTLPDDLTPNETVRYLAQRLGVALEPEFDSFVDHHRAKGSMFSDWQAAIRTWIRNAHKYGSRSGPRVRSEPDDRLQRQADRVRMLREQEAAEERRGASGGGS